MTQPREQLREVLQRHNDGVLDNDSPVIDEVAEVATAHTKAVLEKLKEKALRPLVAIPQVSLEENDLVFVKDIDQAIKELEER